MSVLLQVECTTWVKSGDVSASLFSGGLLSLLLPVASWRVFVFPFPPILEACSRFFSSWVVSETQGWGGESSLQASSRGPLQPPPPPPPEIKKKKWRNTTESAMAPEFCGWRHVHVTHHMQGVQEGRKRFFCLSAHMGKLPPSSREGEKKSTQKKLKKDKHFFVSQRLTLSLLRPSFSFPLSLSLPLACLLLLLLLWSARGASRTTNDNHHHQLFLLLLSLFCLFSHLLERVTQVHNSTFNNANTLENYIYICM